MKLVRALLVLAAACGARREPAPVVGPALGSHHAATATHARGDTRAPPPAFAQQLLAAAHELAVARPAPDHAPISHALERLADALEVVAPGRPADIVRVRQSARELGAGAHSDGHAPTHAAVVRTGLEGAARALRELPLRGVEPSSLQGLRVREAARALASAAAAIDPDAPLLDQYGMVRTAIRESTRAVFAAVGAPEPDLGDVPRGNG